MNQKQQLNSSQQYQLIEAAIHFLAKNHSAQPSLIEIAEHIGLSQFYFQRLFSQWVGISPKRFLQFLNKEYIKTLLAEGYSSLEAGYQAGLSSSSRLHELFISTEAISPAQYRSMGKDLQISYGFHESPFGDYLLATTDKGICQLSFLQNNKAALEQELKDEWARANVELNQQLSEQTHRQLFARENEESDKIKLLLKGTNFQIQVWQALLKLPFGSINDYSGVAANIAQPKASRACASAIAKNKIAYLIPCHRVVRKVGLSGEYRWGSERKKIILAYEASKKNQ